ncbi:MAG: Uma2 family endonuclease [Myxococcota bacterium]
MAEPAASLTYAEYLALEKRTGVRHDFVGGRAIAMAGGTPEHARLCLAVGAELRAALAGGPCVAYGSELKLLVEATGRATYADAAVVCGEAEPSEIDRNALTNPQVVVEVLSRGTEADDRGEKFAHYQRLPSLQEYVLVAQDEARVEVFRRGNEAGEWVLKSFGPGDAFELPSLGLRVSVDAVYGGG